MRKAVSGLITFLFSIVILSVVVSFFMDESFKNIRVDLPQITRPPSKRVADTWFSFPTQHSGLYDYKWLIGRAFPKKAEESHSFAAVDMQFYRSQNLPSMSLDIASLKLLGPDGAFYSTRLQDLQAYYALLKVASRDEADKPVPIRISDVRAVSALAGFNYAENKDVVRKALFSQAIITETLGTHITGIKNLVIPVAFVPAETAKNYGVNGARNAAMNQMAKNIFDAMRKLQKEIPANTVRFLLSNHLDFETLQNKDNVALNQYVGFLPDELVRIRNEIIDQNAYAGSPIANIGQKIAFALDTSLLVKFWLNSDVSALKDKSGTPVTVDELNGLLQKAFVVKDRDENAKERLIKIIYASYFLSGEETRTAQPAVHVPYFRAATPRQVNTQLRLFTDIFEMSDIGIENDTAVVHYLPAREYFPLLHRIAKPLARRWRMYQKKDGADRSEQKKQVKLLKDQLHLYIR